MATTERKATVFNEAQLYLLEVFSCVKTKKELNEIKDLISDYYFKKAEAAWDKYNKKKKSTRKSATRSLKQ